MLELTNTEQVIMKCIWEIGDNVAVADLLERLKTEYGKEYARTTISVFMSYLRDKGYVTYEKRSHAYVYKPLISEQDYQKELMKLKTKAFMRDRKSTRLNSSHRSQSRMPSSA